MTPIRGRLTRAGLTVLALAALVPDWTSTVEAQYQTPVNPCATINESNCVAMVIKPTFQVKNIHPQVNQVQVWCSTKIAEPNVYAAAVSPSINVQNRDASYSGTMRLLILKSQVSPGQQFTLTCEIMLTKTSSTGASERALAVASATSPQSPTDTNWNLVAAGSMVKWNQVVSFPAIP